MAALDTRRNNGIRICLLRNGDKRFLKPYVMNPRSTRTIDSFMDDVTTIVRMPVRKVFTPNHGHRIRTLEQLQSNGSYVVAGGEPFKNIGYSDVREPGIQRLPPSKELEIVVPARHSRYRNVPGRARNYADSKPQGILTIYVFCNGLKFSQSRKVMFPRNLNMDQILECVNEKVSSVMGAVFYLFRKSDSVRISEPSQLENKELYVAVGRDGHLKKNVTYGDNDQAGRRTSTKPVIKKVQPDRTGPRRTRKKKSMPAQRVEPAKASDEEFKGFSSSEDSPREYRGSKIELEEQEAKEEELIKEESSFVGDNGVPLDDILNERKQSLGESRGPEGYEASGDDEEDAQEIMADHSEPREPAGYEASGNDIEDAQEIVDEHSESRGPAGYEASGNYVENAQEVVDDHSEPVEQVRQDVSDERRNSDGYEASGNDTEDAQEVSDEQNELAAQDRQGGDQRRDSEVKPSVYEASGDQQEDGAEIMDDRETKEDKPIDQMPAEEVTEEEIAEDEPQPKQETNDARL